MTTKRFSVRFFDEYPHKYHQPRPRRRPSGPNAANAAPLRNLGKAVAVVAAVLGPETADVLVTSLITRGTKASRSAKYVRNPRELAADSQTRLND